MTWLAWFLRSNLHKIEFFNSVHEVFFDTLCLNDYGPTLRLLKVEVLSTPLLRDVTARPT